MLIYKCDKCGHEARMDRIVGNEFRYYDAGFRTLSEAFRTEQVKDLCGECFRKANDAYHAQLDAAMRGVRLDF